MVDDMIDGLEDFEEMLTDIAISLYFEDWDMDKNGEISECDMNKAFEEQEIDEEEAASIMDNFYSTDENEDGFVDYWEFYDSLKEDIEEDARAWATTFA